MSETTPKGLKIMYRCWSIALALFGLAVLIGTAGGSDLGAYTPEQIAPRVIAGLTLIAAGITGARICTKKEYIKERQEKLRARDTYSPYTKENEQN